MSPDAQSKSFEGFQSQTKSVEALPIRIEYQSPRYEHFMRPNDDDWLLCFSPVKGRWNSGRIRGTTNLDPYPIRDAFETIETAEEAVRFLSESGTFWPFTQVLWSQFREWQAFFGWLRLDPARANKSPEGKRAWDTALGLGSSFFAQTDAEFTRSRFPEDAIEQMGAERWRENQIQDRHTLFCLRRFALHPERRNEGSRVSLGWYDPKLKHAPEDWKMRRKGSAKGAVFEPFLRIEALNVLEAVAATIYADRVNGTRFRKCKHCGKLFKVESDHEQAFCPAPEHLKSSPCKNAYFQHERRRNERNAIELLLEGWRAGLSEVELEKQASEQGIHVSTQIRTKARKIAQGDAQ
jgi:hypothetical protein